MKLRTNLSRLEGLNQLSMLAPSEGVGGVTGEIYIDFTRAADGAPPNAVTGQTTLRETASGAIVQASVSGGALVAAASGAGTTASYSGWRLPEDVLSAYADVSFGDAFDVVALIAAADVTNAAVVDSSLHIVFAAGLYQIGRWSDGVLSNDYTDTFAAVPYGAKRRVGWRISGTTLFVLLPNGQEISITDAAFTGRANHALIFEHYRSTTGAPTSKIYGAACNLFADPAAAGRTNLITQRNNVANAAWTKNNLPTITSGLPDAAGGVLAEQLLENTTTGFHNITQTLSKGGAAIKRYTLRAKVKGVSRSWVMLQAFNAGFSANATASFDIATPALGSKGGTFTDKTTMAYPLGNGFLQVQMDFCSDADASIVPIFAPASADNTGSYLGEVTKGIQIYDQWLFERPL